MEGMRKVAYIGFNMTGIIGVKRLKILESHFGSILDAWEADPVVVSRVLGLGSELANRITAIKRDRSVEREMELAEKLGVDIITIEDEDYPLYLKEIFSPPILLYVYGKLVSDALRIAVVGTRNPTSYGRKVAKDVSSYLADMGVTVVSGLAYGIDTEAHLAALDKGGRTMAVIATGMDIVYPRSNRGILERIMESDGVVITEYPFGTLPNRRNFPLRNRIISGVSQGVVVVEAPAKSGALITANFAVEQNRELFVIPGSVYNKKCEGSNRLMQQGAYPVLHPSDILRELGYPFQKDSGLPSRGKDVAEDERRILEVMDYVEPVSIDYIVEKTGMRVELVRSKLMLLEMRELVLSINDGRYIRVGGDSDG